MKNVVVYTTPTCQYCKMAKDFFQANSVAYSEHDVAADEALRNEMVEKSGQMGVPVIDIEGEIIVGFDEPRIKEVLGL
jgi:glutaredoxin-like YruB-family protein